MYGTKKGTEGKTLVKTKKEIFELLLSLERLFSHRAISHTIPEAMGQSPCLRPLSITPLLIA